MNEQNKLGGPKLWLAAVVLLSALVGVWNAEDPYSPPKLLAGSPEVSTIALVEEQADSESPADSLPMEEIQSTLAQAGCPGWMVLAAEGEAALTPPGPAGIVPSDVQAMAWRVPNSESSSATNSVPRVNYPIQVRVANRLHASPSVAGARLQVGAADDSDDLLDGQPDLLHSPETVSTEAVAPAVQSPLVVPKLEVLEPKVEQPEAVMPSPEKLSPQGLELAPPVPATPQPLRFTNPKPISELVYPAPKLQPEVLPAPVAVPHPHPQAQPRAIPTQSPFLPTPAPTPTMPHAMPHAVPHALPAGNGAASAGNKSSNKKSTPQKTYCEFLAESRYPSAQACAKCHEKIYDEWSVSSHAYAAISPMYQKFEQRINDLSQASVGYFCYRCHLPVGTTMGVSRATPLWELPLVAREGVTCIACHRVNQRYGKVNGHRRIEPGNIHDPVYGPIGGSGVAEVIAQKNKYKVKTSPSETGPGLDMHAAGIGFDQLSKGEFCMSCHQVAVHPGVKLEVVYEQWRASPACKKGISCIDCHMGRLPGVPSGFEVGAAAKIGDNVVNSNRRHANHNFYGPGYSIAHPGVFPFNIDANRWSMKTWLKFDWRAGWGTEEFEEALDDGLLHASFPPEWEEVDDRYDAREVIDANLKKLDDKNISRHQLMENGSHVDGPYFDTQLVRGKTFKFHYVMTNLNEGHNLPSGSLGAQPQLWAHVVLIGPRGQRLWESGYTDSWGDVCDIHSVDVRHKRVPFDTQLFNLQTMFLTTGVKGTDREFPLPVNFSFDQMPYLRPGAQPTSLINHPPFIRMESRSLPPLGSRNIPYKVPAHLMQEPGHYRLSFRLRSRLEPIYFMRFCGATEEMIRSMNEGILNFHQSSVEFCVQ